MRGEAVRVGRCERCLQRRAVPGDIWCYRCRSEPSPPIRLQTPETELIDHEGLLVRASEIKPANVKFLQTPELPLGCLTLIVGLGGLGKSHFTVETAARATRGQLKGDLRGIPVGVVMATVEDGLATTMVPRLIAAGADLDRVHFVSQDEPFSIPNDLELLEEAIVGKDVRMLVIDPLVAYIPAKLDSHKDQHARVALAPLAALAAKHEIAVPAVMHLNKAAEATSLFLRVSSSTGFLNAARSALLVAQDPDDADARIIAHGKHNLSEAGPSRRFRIVGTEVTTDDEPIRTSQIKWCGTSGHSVEDLLRSDHRRDPRDKAEAFLLSRLADGPVRFDEIQRDASTEGIADRTLHRAREELGIATTRERRFGAPSWWGYEGDFETDEEGRLVPPPHVGEEVARLDLDGGGAAGQDTSATSSSSGGTTDGTAGGAA